MFRSILSSLLAVAMATEDHWAVIIAGSNTYANYRHQADACHAYQLAKQGGIAEDHIIMFMYDDIANDPENPFPGQMFNKPTAAGTPGYDVYAGCNASYTGADVTADKFLAVLTGDAATAGGPVLGSTAEDNVFIYYTDHGGVGIIAMPNNEPLLTAADLNAALVTMNTNGMYKRLVFYLEACESGSMFEGGLLANDTMVYATTASSGAESSWGTYCGDDATVDGTAINSCLGDLYSVSWMEDSDAGIFHESLDDQTQATIVATNQSHVQIYGDKSYDSDFVAAFQGTSADKRGSLRGATRKPARAAHARPGRVSARETTLSYLEAKVLNAKTPAAKLEAQGAYAAELAHRAGTAARFNSIANAHGHTLHHLFEQGKTLPTGAFSEATWGCYKRAIEEVRTVCPRGIQSEHVMDHLKVLAALCYENAEAPVAHSVKAACAAN